jgi:acyl CoA:acetate/3-ketoacid CoA transferase alpha subunit
MNILDAGQGDLIQPADLDAFRKHNREKPKAMIDKRMTEAEAIDRFVFDGAYVGTELYGTVRCPMSLVNELIRQGKKDLRMAGQGVLETDVLLAAHLVKELDLTYIGLEVYGISHPFRREMENGRIEKCVEWSNAALAWRFKAAAMGVPFLPMRSMLGTDTFKYSAAKVVNDPYGGGRVAIVPALILDVGLIHVHRADKFGNAQIDGISGFCAEMARASKRLIVSAEKIVDSEEIRAKPDRTIIPYFLVDAVVEAPFGSHPGEMYYQYARDEDQIKEWVEASKTEDGSQAYLEKYVHDHDGHEQYLDFIGRDKLEQLRSEIRGRAS